MSLSVIARLFSIHHHGTVYITPRCPRKHQNVVEAAGMSDKPLNFRGMLLLGRGGT